MTLEQAIQVARASLHNLNCKAGDEAEIRDGAAQEAYDVLARLHPDVRGDTVSIRWQSSRP